MKEPADKLHVDELRQQLRALGYLDAGVNRFVLGPATDRRRPSSIALLAALRVGALAALLLGPAAAIGMNGRLPGLVTGPRDAIVIAIYLGLFFGAAVSLVTFRHDSGGRDGCRVAAVSRARRVSRIAGAAIAVACLPISRSGGEARMPGLDGRAPAWTAFALAVAVAISLLLGHVSTSAAFAVAIARHGHDWTRGRRIAAVSIATVRLAADDCCGRARVRRSRGAARRHGAARGERGRASPACRRLERSARTCDRDRRRRSGVLDDVVASGRIPSLARALSGTRATLELEDSIGSPRPGARVDHDRDRDRRQRFTASMVSKPGASQACRARWPPKNSRGSAQSIRASTDLLRLTRPSIASGNERRVKTLWEVAADAGLRTVGRELVGDVARVLGDGWHRDPERSRRAAPRARRSARCRDRAGRSLRPTSSASGRRFAREPMASHSRMPQRLLWSGSDLQEPLERSSRTGRDATRTCYARFRHRHRI